MNIKIKLLELNRRQVDLLEELLKRGYSTMCTATLSAIVNHRINTPLACRVREEIYDIMEEWEKEAK